jgi:hypothetical protein
MARWLSIHELPLGDWVWIGVMFTLSVFILGMMCFVVFFDTDVKRDKRLRDHLKRNPNALSALFANQSDMV